VAGSDEDLELLRLTARKLFGSESDGQSLPRFAELGWVGLLVDEEVGGSGWHPIETGVVIEESGRVRLELPLLTSIIGAGLLGRKPESVSSQQWLEPVLAGRVGVALGVGAVSAENGTGGTARISGRMPRVVDPSAGNLLIVCDAGRSNAIYALRLDQPGVSTRESVWELDTTRRVGRIDLQHAQAELINRGAPEDSGKNVPLMALARVLSCCDGIGVFAAARERLTEYLSHRIAFQAPIASLQAIQHRLVNLYVVERQMRAIAMSALASAAIGADSAVHDAILAHVFVEQYCQAGIDECIQLSGGIGFTWEYPLHHEMRRAGLDTRIFGPPCREIQFERIESTK
jgi:alkylation response protein AidB-like acyl-CoA dehydrogenase